jgi:hypothetical protein
MASIILCWIMGLVGYSLMVHRYDALIACTAAVLLSKFSGSATAKNMGRIQGVVLGKVSGELVYALLGWCEIWAYIAFSICFCLWVGATMYVHHSSQKFGYIGCLAGALGTKGFLRGCSNDVVDPRQSYYSVISSVLAIFVMSTVDSFTTKRPSLLAYKELVNVWESMQDNVKKFLDPTHKNCPLYEDALDSLVTAGNLGDEARDEPRYWRVPWRTSLFHKASHCAHDMRLNLHCLESTAAKNGEKGAEKEAWFMHIISLESFQRVSEELFVKMEQTRLLLDVFTHDTSERFTPLDDPVIQREVVHDTEEVIAEVNKVVDRTKIADIDNLEDDNAVQICFVLRCMRLMMTSMHDFQQAVLANVI